MMNKDYHQRSHQISVKRLA